MYISSISKKTSLKTIKLATLFFFGGLGLFSTQISALPTQDGTLGRSNNGNARHHARANGSPRIVGGLPALYTNFSSSIFLVTKSSTDTLYCTGTLIADNVVLTAAHCVKTGTTEFKASQMTVYAGSDKFTSFKQFEASEIIVHPGFVYETLINDIAVVVLSEPIPSEVSNTIRIYNQSLVDNDVLTIVGWGTTSSGSVGPSSTLNQINLSVTSDNTCKSLLGQWSDNDGATICTLNADNKGPCFGDSGGSALVNKGDNVYLVGVTSSLRYPKDWSQFQCGQTGSGNFFSNAYYYIDWISSASGVSRDVLLSGQKELSGDIPSTSSVVQSIGSSKTSSSSTVQLADSRDNDFGTATTTGTTTDTATATTTDTATSVHTTTSISTATSSNTQSARISTTIANTSQATRSEKSASTNTSASVSSVADVLAQLTSIDGSLLSNLAQVADTKTYSVYSSTASDDTSLYNQRSNGSAELLLSSSSHIGSLGLVSLLPCAFLSVFYIFAI